MASEDKDIIINYRDVVISHEDHNILKAVNLVVHNGEFVYLIGKVGSGKTSLIRSLIAENPITECKKAKILKWDLKRIRSRQIPYLRRSIGVVFQDFQLLMDRSVYDNLEFVLRATGWNSAHKIRERIEEVLDSVGMKDKASQMPHLLSGGEQQRVAIARALLNDPPIILADEPTGNLDPEATIGIMDLLMNINTYNGTAVVMITHNKSILQNYPARTVICENETLRELQSEILTIDLDF
ncbi:MAG: ATP-binding cassette domain-containing protein [Bacteroidales bacterium]|nr:ATP-binding cassette domain-containing protein [Bacteroidales bacterium]